MLNRAAVILRPVSLTMVRLGSIAGLLWAVEAAVSVALAADGPTGAGSG